MIETILSVMIFYHSWPDDVYEEHLVYHLHQLSYQ